MPGGYFSKARFVLAANYLRLLPPPQSLAQAIALAFNALGYLIEPPGSGAPTVWSVVYDLSNRILYYRNIDNQKIRFLKLDDINFSDKTSRSLLINNQLSGNIAKQF